MWQALSSVFVSILVYLFFEILGWANVQLFNRVIVLTFFCLFYIIILVSLEGLKVRFSKKFYIFSYALVRTTPLLFVAHFISGSLQGFYSLSELEFGLLFFVIVFIADNLPFLFLKTYGLIKKKSVFTKGDSVANDIGVGIILFLFAGLFTVICLYLMPYFFIFEVGFTVFFSLSAMGFIRFVTSLPFIGKI